MRSRSLQGLAFVRGFSAYKHKPTKYENISQKYEKRKKYEIWTSIELNVQNSKFRPALSMVKSRLDEDQNPHFEEFKSIGANGHCYSTREIHSRVYGVFRLSYSTELENPNILTKFTPLIHWNFHGDTIRNVKITSRAFKLYNFNPNFHLNLTFPFSHSLGIQNPNLAFNSLHELE